MKKNRHGIPILDRDYAEILEERWSDENMRWAS
jgi:hypothetical protein